MTKAGPYDGVTSSEGSIERAMEAGGGVLRLAPAWVPRSFCTPGRRLRLHPDDYFPLGKERGGIDERWFASAIRAENGPLTDPYEGLSLVVGTDGEVIPFDEFIAHLKAEAIGPLWGEYGTWPMYSKFFDNQFPLPFHLHQKDEHAALVGKRGKPEAYYFPPQLNNHGGEFPYTFFGLHPETTRQQVLDKLEAFLRGGDNRITELSSAHRITPGTGWDVPPGVLHAPASMCTYEPQAASDVFAMTESWSNNREVADELLWKDVPADRVGDLEFILEIIDWDLNVDPEFWSHRFTPPVETDASAAAGRDRYVERWITYRSPAFSAKELTVAPGCEVSIDESDAYGFIAVDGFGEINGQEVSAISSIRYGQLSHDEYFVTSSAAQAGVRIRNTSPSADLVLLKHFGPGNRELAADRGAVAAERA
ncbi:MAG: hypothetical protein IT189_04860 [Microbacteriaceae bacterium]|nr:hypothetical protein [Microbacteriaceae bacterium]